ncbi:MAG: amidase [Ktedonobacterales bacterium]|nr:amidase [Ktedonobacterales bacterium]
MPTDREPSDREPPPTEAVIPTIAEAARLLRAGTVSSVELVERCLRRIAWAEPRIHACLTIMAEAALAAARAADEALGARRARGPLHGIPLGIKDLIATRGVRTTAGSRVLEDWIPDEDAMVMTKLAEAGAIALCKTNTHEFAFGTVTPPTRNPWHTARVPGGSSGGSAAGLVAGEFLGALGTDTGGSIRIPAGWCGVTGLKPTFGLVSRAGIIPLSWSLDHAGPIAWTVEDCALLLDALAGYDAADPASVDVPLLDYTAALASAREPAEAVRGTRLGIPTSYFSDVVDAEVAAAVRAAIRTFTDLGASVEAVELPDEWDDLFTAVYRAVQRPEAYTYHSDMGWLESRADRYSPVVRANIEAGGASRASDYIRAQRRRRTLTEGMRATLRAVDALITPTLAIPAPLVEHYDDAFTVDGRAIVGGSLRLTMPFDLTGQPALTLPCGFTADGLPIALQLAAGHFGEATLLRLGHAYQRVTDWHTRRPERTGPA